MCVYVLWAVYYCKYLCVLVCVYIHILFVQYICIHLSIHTCVTEKCTCKHTGMHACVHTHHYLLHFRKLWHQEVVGLLQGPQPLGEVKTGRCMESHPTEHTSLKQGTRFSSSIRELSLLADGDRESLGTGI